MRCLSLAGYAVLCSPAMAFAQEAADGPLDSWIKYTPQDWAFLVALCVLAIWFRRSNAISERVADIAPSIVALVYGGLQAVEAGYGVGTHIMFKGIIMAAGSVAAQQVATKFLPTPNPPAVPNGPASSQIPSAH